MNRLGQALADVRNAPDQASRTDALVVWLTEATRVLDEFRELELHLLHRGVVWNPRRLAELTDEED